MIYSHFTNSGSGGQDGFTGEFFADNNSVKIETK